MLGSSKLRQRFARRFDFNSAAFGALTKHRPGCTRISQDGKETSVRLLIGTSAGDLSGEDNVRRKRSAYGVEEGVKWTVKRRFGSSRPCTASATHFGKVRLDKAFRSARHNTTIISQEHELTRIECGPEPGMSGPTGSGPAKSPGPQPTGWAARRSRSAACSDAHPGTLAKWERGEKEPIGVLLGRAKRFLQDG